MADSKVSQMTERVSATLGTDLLMVVGNTVATPTNYRVQVKNFLSDVLVDMPQTTWSAFKITANVTANATAATLIAGEFMLQANAASGFTVQNRYGAKMGVTITGANSNTTGLMCGAAVSLDPGVSNFVGSTTFGMIVSHVIANTSLSRAVSPRAYFGVLENAGAAGNTTSYLMDVGALGQNVSQNVTTGNGSVVFSRANNYTLLGINRTLRVSVNGETLYLLLSNVVPSFA